GASSETTWRSWQDNLPDSNGDILSETFTSILCSHFWTSIRGIGTDTWFHCSSNCYYSSHFCLGNSCGCSSGGCFSPACGVRSFCWVVQTKEAMAKVDERGKVQGTG